MGTSGAKATSAAKAVTDEVVDILAPLGGVTSRSMFGGHGIFHEGLMFAIVDSEGRLYLRADQSTAPAFEAAGSIKHARMPYWEVPQSVRAERSRLLDWATTAAEVAAQAKS